MESFDRQMYVKLTSGLSTGNMRQVAISICSFCSSHIASQSTEYIALLVAVVVVAPASGEQRHDILFNGEYELFPSDSQ